MFRRLALASCLAAFAAATAPAHALNPQPLPPSPCKCDAYKSYSFKQRYLRMLILKQHVLKYRAAAVR